MGDLALQMDLSHHAMCRHLALLLDQGMLECRAEGVWRYYACKSEEAKAVMRLLDELACDNALPDLSLALLGP
ncbi:ArsR/SmtB family transcription factor [Mesorhizobium sp. 43Arga]